MIRVWIPQKPTVFSVKFVFLKRTKIIKRGRGWPILTCGCGNNKNRPRPVWPDGKTISSIFGQSHEIFAMVGSKCSQVLNYHSKCCPILLQVYQSGEISPNLVTLATTSFQMKSIRRSEQFNRENWTWLEKNLTDEFWKNDQIFLLDRLRRHRDRRSLFANSNLYGTNALQLQHFAYFSCSLSIPKPLLWSKNDFYFLRWKIGAIVELAYACCCCLKSCTH